AEVKSLVVNFDTQMNGLACRNGNERRESVALRRIRQAGHHAQMFANGFVVRNVEVMEFCAVVITNQAGHLLKMFRFELEHRLRAEAMRLLAACYERLPKQTANRLAA